MGDCVELTYFDHRGHRRSGGRDQSSGRNLRTRGADADAEAGAGGCG